MKTYIAGPLTHHADIDLKKVYERIGELCESKGVKAHVPHISGTDPIKNPDVTAQDVWCLNNDCVSNANFIIAYVGKPSLGVGAELELARIGKTDIILWWYKDEKISRMSRGNPGITEELEIENEEELYEKLAELLEKKYKL